MDHLQCDIIVNTKTIIFPIGYMLLIANNNNALHETLTMQYNHNYYQNKHKMSQLIFQINQLTLCRDRAHRF